MDSTYDPERLLAKILEWKKAAETADPACRELYNSLVRKAMARLDKCYMTPAMLDSTADKR